MSCVQCGACVCAFFGLSEDECCGAGLAPCCYLYSCGMCDFTTWLDDLGPCEWHLELIQEAQLKEDEKNGEKKEDNE